jgi:hypothetical protein
VDGTAGTSPPAQNIHPLNTHLSSHKPPLHTPQRTTLNTNPTTRNP